jgi:hypothetical protein
MLCDIFPINVLLNPMSNKHIKFINDANKIGATKGIKTDGKGALAINCWDLCNEHVRSIAHLLNLKSHASAMALLRPAVEAFVRGLWVCEFVELSQVSKLAESDGAWPKFDKMAKKVNSRLGDKAILERYMCKEYGLMNSFTHGSSHQILSRFDGQTMCFSLEVEQLSALYTELALLSFSANILIAETAGDSQKADELEALWREVGI